MNKSLLVLGLSVLVTGSAFAQTFGPATGFTIPDNSATPGSSSLTVTDPGTIASLDFVEIDFGNPGHTWVGDLIVTFRNTTTGDDVHLFSRPGATTTTGTGDSSNLTGVYRFTATGASFSAAAATVLGTQSVPNGAYARSSHAAGSFVNSLGVQQFDADDFSVFAGDAIAGNWSLLINDNAGADTGAIVGWSFGVTATPVPEPASMAVLGLGLVGLIKRRRK